MITTEELNKLGFIKLRHPLDTRPARGNYYRSCEKGSLSINQRRDTLRIGGCTGGRAFLIHLKSATQLQIILDALLND